MSLRNTVKPRTSKPAMTLVQREAEIAALRAALPTRTKRALRRMTSLRAG